MSDFIVETFTELLIAAAFILLIRLYVKKFTKKSACPYCGVKDYKRVQRDVFTKFILFFMNIQTLKCTKCSHKFNLILKRNKR